MFYEYVLQVKNGRFYTGYSSNLRERIKSHAKGRVAQTKGLGPVRLVFYAAFVSKKLALSFENYLKMSSGYAFRNKRFLDGD